MDTKETGSYSDFYRKLRPEYFSDSKIEYKVKLPKEHLAYEINMISTNQKHDAFEVLCRKLAEKFISPNLIPQVGPTGGGDGKTDSETYPTSVNIADRWFTPENGWTKDENWAFAISAKKEWKSKIKSDVIKIVETQRGYTRVYFFTNQKVSSKIKKETQDQLIKQLKIDIVILDAEWIIEKIYDNKLINIAIESLNLSDIYKEQIIEVGKNDASRIKKLEDLENKIVKSNRYFEYDYQLVEDALETAILSRMLEKSKAEVIGKFERALRLGRKLDNSRQLMRIHYQKAWTHINWYDDYDVFLVEYYSFKKYSKIDPNILGLELHSTLIQLLWNISNNEHCTIVIPFKEELTEYIDFLDNCIQQTTKITTSLVAQVYKSLLNVIFRYNEEIGASYEFDQITKYIEISQSHIEFPFELFKNLIEAIGKVFPNDKSYDNLIDCIANIEGQKSSALSSGMTFLNRGIQKLDNNYNKESLIYLGKAVKKIAKEDDNLLYIALDGLTKAYQRLGLYWAANNTILAALNIYTNKWYKLGSLDPRLLRCVDVILKNESYIGRIPYLLGWSEMYKVIYPQFEHKELDEELPTHSLVDACLSVRLLNENYSNWKDYLLLPEILAKEELYLSHDAVMYMLGHTSAITEKYKEITPSKNIDEVFSVAANQPFREQIAYETNLMYNSIIEFGSIILGTKITLKVEKNKSLVILAEAILAYLESFLATTFEEVYPSCEEILIEIKNKNNEYYNLSNNNSFKYLLEINIEEYDRNIEGFSELFFELTTNIVTKNFLFGDPEPFLKKLFIQDEILERQFTIQMHRTITHNILGLFPKIFLDDWIRSTTNTYNFTREVNSLKLTSSKNLKPQIEDDNKWEIEMHNQNRVASIFDHYLWDNADWKGFGFFHRGNTLFGIFLAFADKNLGKKIFEEWIEKYTNKDINEEIYIGIVRGVNKEHPHRYRVLLTKNIPHSEKSKNNSIMTLARTLEMYAESPTNLNNLVNGYKYFNQYFLCPAYIDENGQIEIYEDLGILKKELSIKSAWEVSELDVESLGIRDDDTPIIPNGVVDVPLLKVLKKRSK